MSNVGRISETWSDESRVAALAARRKKLTGKQRETLRALHDGIVLYHVPNGAAGMKQYVHPQVYRELKRGGLIAHDIPASKTYLRHKRGEKPQKLISHYALKLTDEGRAVAAGL